MNKEDLNAAALQFAQKTGHDGSLTTKLLRGFIVGAQFAIDKLGVKYAAEQKPKHLTRNIPVIFEDGVRIGWYNPSSDKWIINGRPVDEKPIAFIEIAND